MRDAWLFGAVVVILLATLPPQPGTTSGAFLRSLLPHNLRWGDVAQNLLLYCPLGMVLGARGVSPRTALGASAGLSLTTELLQFAIPGRDPAARDVFVNGLGSLLAYSAVQWTRLGPRLISALVASEGWLGQARNPGARRASLFLFGWAFAITIVLATTAALLQPAPLSIGGLAVASPVIDRSAGPLRIGSSGAHGGFFRGTIDEVRIYERARTPEEIAEDMLKGRSTASPADQGLVAAYGFNANSGSVAHDDTGRARDGVVSGATWTPEGRYGGALMFDGRSSEVVVPRTAALDLDKAMTLEAWVLASGEPLAEATVIGKSGDAYYLRASSNMGAFRAAGGGRFGAMPRFVHLAEPFRAGEWTHLATTYDGQSIRMYVNGALSSTRVHWSPHRPERASLNGTELQSGLVPDAAAFRHELMQAVTLETMLICSTLNDTPAPAFVIAGLQSSEPLALIASGRDLFIKPLARGARFGVASPATRVSGALRGCDAGRRLALTVSGPLQNPRVTVGTDQPPASTPSLGAGWMFLIHADLLPGWAELTATAVWLALLALPLGLWARSTITGAVSLSLVIATLLYIPNLYHLRMLYIHEAAALMVGAALGMVARATSLRAISPPNNLARSGDA